MKAEEYAHVIESERKQQEAEAAEASKIRNCLRSEDGTLFLNRVREQLDLDLSKMKKARDVVDFRFYQGRVDAWEKILFMKEE
jgi:hypothetical protein